MGPSAATGEACGGELVALALHVRPEVADTDLVVHSLTTSMPTAISERKVEPCEHCGTHVAWNHNSVAGLTIVEDDTIQDVINQLVMVSHSQAVSAWKAAVSCNGESRALSVVQSALESSSSLSAMPTRKRARCSWPARRPSPPGGWDDLMAQPADPRNMNAMADCSNTS